MILVNYRHPVLAEQVSHMPVLLLECEHAQREPLSSLLLPVALSYSQALIQIEYNEDHDHIRSFFFSDTLCAMDMKAY